MNTLARTGSQQLLQYHFIQIDFILCCWTPNFYHSINNFLIFHLRPLSPYPNHFYSLNMIFTEKLLTNPFRIQFSSRLTAETSPSISPEQYPLLLHTTLPIIGLQQARIRLHIHTGMIYARLFSFAERDFHA